MRIASDTIAVVTGAAHGIGRAIVNDLAGRGARIVALDVDLDAISTLPTGVRVMQCDVRDPAALAAAAEIVVAEFGTVTLVVACAGVSVAGPVEALTLAQLQRAMDVNYWGVVHTSRCFLPALRAAASSGRTAGLCVVLSEFALFVLPTKAAYAASKHAAHAFTLALMAELDGSGIQVTAAYPGATATEFVSRGEASDTTRQSREAALLARGQSPERVAARILGGIATGRARVLVGVDARVVALAMGWAPRLTQWAVRRWWRRVPFL